MKNECLSENAPCLICNNCQKVIDENALDVLWFGKDKPVVVGDSENIVQDSYVVPYEFKNKYFILCNFDSATTQAQNKLLKIIEEPQNFDKYVILVSNLDSILATIKSRCQIFDLPRFSTDELKSIFDYEIGNAKKINFGAEFASGNLSKLNIIYNDADFEEIYSLCVKLLTNLKSSANVLEFSYQILKYKEKIEMFLEILSSLYADILKVKEGHGELIENSSQINMFSVLANSFNTQAIIKIVKEIQKVKQKLKFNANVSSIVDNLLLKILEINYICK